MSWWESEFSAGSDGKAWPHGRKSKAEAALPREPLGWGGLQGPWSQARPLCTALTPLSFVGVTAIGGVSQARPFLHGISVRKIPRSPTAALCRGHMQSSPALVPCHMLRPVRVWVHSSLRPQPAQPPPPPPHGGRWSSEAMLAHLWDPRTLSRPPQSRAYLIRIGRRGVPFSHWEIRAE